MRTSFAAPAVLSALAALACATIHVGSDFERGLDFTRYRTFDWAAADALPAGDARLDRDLRLQDRIQGAIEKQLAARGFALSATSAPDFLIHYHVSVRRRLDVDAEDRGDAVVNIPTGLRRHADVEAGTLVVDIVDARTRHVIWRGWAQDALEGVFDDPGRLARTLDEATRRVFERLPRGGAERTNESVRPDGQH